MTSISHSINLMESMAYKQFTFHPVTDSTCQHTELPKKTETDTVITDCNMLEPVKREQKRQNWHN